MSAVLRRRESSKSGKSAGSIKMYFTEGKVGQLGGKNRVCDSSAGGFPEAVSL